MYFVVFISKFELQKIFKLLIFQLLVGIKDTNDELVSLTLRSLAELVPLLGSDIVIGGKRAKLFTDGRPVQHSTTKHHKQRPIPPPAATEPTELIILPERPQPDGEEVENSTDEMEQSADVDDDLETWEDWDANENPQNNTENVFTPTHTEPDLLLQTSTNNAKFETHRKKSLPDITELDIKNQTNGRENDDDVDFFQDMEPVIETKPRFVAVVEGGVDEKMLLESVKKMSLSVEESGEDGWGDEEWD